MHEVHARIEPAEQAVRRVQQRQRILVPAHRLHQQRQFAHRLGFVQHGAGAHGQFDRRAQPRLAERGPAGLAIDHADELVGFRLVGAQIELIEDRERGFGHPARLVVALAQKVRLGVIRETHPLQIHVACTLGDLVTLAEIAVGPIVLPQVGMSDAKIDVCPGRAMLVIGGAIVLDGALVMPDSLDQLAPDVRENAEVLLDACEELAGLPAALERLEEVPARLFHRARAQRETAHGVECFAGEHVVAERARDFVAAVTEVARPGRLVAMMQHDGEPPQRLGENRLFAGAFGSGNRRLVELYGFGDARGAFAAARVVQQIGCRSIYHATT